ELSSSDSIAKYIAECRNMGIPLLAPDVNESGYVFTVVGDAIRFGLGAVKGVGEGAIESLLEARRRVGRFTSPAQVATEVVANHKVFESLIKAGAFEGFNANRAALWAVLDDLLEYGQRRRREREDGQNNLFGVPGGGGDAFRREPLPDPSTPPWSERERVKFEKEALGFYLTGNPLTEHQAHLERLVTHTTAALREGTEGTVTVGGIVSGVSRVKIKSGPNQGKYMGRFVLDDLEGSLAVTLFASQLEKFGHLLVDDALVLVKGQVRERGGDFELTVEEIVPVTNLGPLLAEIELVLEASLSTGKMRELRDLLIEHTGHVPVRFQLQLPDRTVWIAPRDTYKVQFGPELKTSIQAILGQEAVHERYDGAPA
ncbi:MAG TPA: OB-fold nucleic acid binding domain-containing protein, partial [Thermoanaerobaculia bacterium]|nr:OB-fold nucleic acid binding domain-containing protein [Thermoanaerobaculia bacterium]